MKNYDIIGATYNATDTNYRKNVNWSKVIVMANDNKDRGNNLART